MANFGYIACLASTISTPDSGYWDVKRVATAAAQDFAKAAAFRDQAERQAIASVRPWWIEGQCDRFKDVKCKTEALIEAFRELEEFTARGKAAGMQLVDLQIGSGQVNQVGLQHWLDESCKALQQQS